MHRIPTTYLSLVLYGVSFPHIKQHEYDALCLTGGARETYGSIAPLSLE